MSFSVVIIGAGPAGEAAAKAVRRLAPALLPGVDVSMTLIEKEHVGGLCLNKGCIPSKTLLEHVKKQIHARQPVDWKQLHAAKRSVVETLRGHLETSFKQLKINRCQGTARFRSAQAIDVTNAEGTQTLPFDRAIIATGTQPFFPPPLNRLREHLWDSDALLEISETPVSLAIVGGGAVGCEFACLLNACGSRVTLIELKDQLLPGEDASVAATLARSFEARGIAIKTGVKVAACEKSNDGWAITLSNGEELSVQRVLVCVGRHPVYDELGLEKAGIAVENGGLKLTPHLQTTNPHVYAAGDAATTKLAHAAAAQAESVAAALLGGPFHYDDRFVPRCLYSWPEVASVGAWKYQLEEQQKPVKTSRGFFKGSARAMAGGDTDGFVQLVFDPQRGTLLGAQIIGPHATELIHIFSVALKKEMTVKELGEVMFAHPTLSEVIKEAALK